MGIERGLDRDIFDRRQNVLLLLSGVFLGSIGILNIMGITRFVDLETKIIFLIFSSFIN